MNKGFSVLICTHNGSNRIPKTLRFLEKQKIDKSIPWEIILVDNASTDGTARIAQLCWKRDIPIRIINEPKLGITNARITGMNFCNYSYIGFIDDDNWAADNWIESAFSYMELHQDAGATGSASEAVFESEPPKWFHTYSKNYAVGNQYEKSGIIKKTYGLLWGAGLVLRKEAWDTLYDFGYNPLIESRKGKSLMSGEESEILLLFRLMGWSLYFNPDLKIQHFMPTSRLNWQYFLRLKRSLGFSSVYYDLYKDVLDSLSKGKNPEPKSWTSELFDTMKKIIKDPLAIPAGLLNIKQGNYRIASMYFNLGRFRHQLQLGHEIEDLNTFLFNKYSKLYNVHNINQIK